MNDKDAGIMGGKQNDFSIGEYLLFQQVRGSENEL